MTARIFHEDRLNAGQPQLILENELMSVMLLPELGGRILDIQTEGFTFLHRIYPRSVQFGAYIEHGGIEECIGKAPGTLWNTPWRVKEMMNGVILSTISSTAFSKVLLQKKVTLDDAEPILQVEYSFINIDPKFNKFTFGIHPELCLGDDFKENEYHIPFEDGILSGTFVEVGLKQFVTPAEGWCATTYNGKAYATLFPTEVIDCLEIYYPRIGTHFVLQPLIWGVGLSPNRKASFTSLTYAGDGDLQTILDLYERKKDELVFSYVPIEPPPEQIFSEREILFTQRRPPITMPIDEFGQLPRGQLRNGFLEQAEIPEEIEQREEEIRARQEDLIERNLMAEAGRIAELAAVQARIVEATRRMLRDLDLPVADEVDLAVEEQNEQEIVQRGRIPRAVQHVNHLFEAIDAERHREIAREKVSFVKGEVTEISLSSIVGAIWMQSWDEPKVEIEITRQVEAMTEENAIEMLNTTRPEITQEGTTLVIQSRGGNGKPIINYSIRIPREMSEIELDFVDGNVSVLDILPARLKINGLSGNIEIKGGITENSIYDVKSVGGNISFNIDPHANCSIKATSLVGAVECDLELFDLKRQPNRISGILNENIAQINLNTVKGNIRIGKI
ncbi:DUF4097 domain-containing protein [Candidatus Poribacteria bacterium]|nr:DUF4097 domain-containing protein [Candidatus Poribacteria bacterium]